MRLNAGTVLMYNLSGPEFSRLRQILAMLRLRLRTVTPDRYHIPLGELALGQGEPGETGEPFAESMLVFCGLGDDLLNQVLQVIRAADLPAIGFKAVLTPTNQDWDSRQLYSHMVEERRNIMEQKRAQKEQGQEKKKKPSRKKSR